MPTAPTGPATRAHSKTSPATRRLQNAYPIPQGQRFLSGSKISYGPKPPGVRLRSCGDVRYATALPPNVLQTIFAAQIQEAIDVPFPWTVTGGVGPYNFSRERRKPQSERTNCIF